ncbi:MAG: nucleoside-diphosphate sugar epimerase/dehydratase [Candidatus Pacebacteria bacterium]|nr:nucleoside-diphosphate sugar epimerase/dehydratase [Candidatus Paceibacterota bacterium]
MSVFTLVRRSWLALFHDAVSAGLIFTLGLYLRWQFEPEQFEFSRFFGGVIGWQITLFLLISTLVFWFTGMYRGVWRYASLEDLLAIFRGVTLSVLLFTLVLFLVSRGDNFPRTAIVVTWLLLMVYLPLPRILYRLWRDGGIENIFLPKQDRIPVLLIGAGDEADIFIHAMRRSKGAYRAVAIIDVTGKRTGQSIRRVPIIGSLAVLQTYPSHESIRNRPQRIIISKNYSPERMNEILQIAEKLALPVSRLPPLGNFSTGSVGEIEIKPINIEDLLNRAQKPLDKAPVESLISGRRILVTGAGGSIGSELVRQLARFNPQSIVLLDSSEYGLYLIDLEIGESFPSLNRIPRLADIRNLGGVETIFKQFKPELVFHAAALKHVPLVELNPLEAIETNVLGTKNIADLCKNYGVLAMVMISSDKAVNPTNIMGATKRLAESWCQALDRLLAQNSNQSDCHYITVRFGNVLGSTGSVVPLFERQLAQGGPLTVTDPAMTRYFMTIREAVSLVLQAAAFGAAHRQDAGKIFILDMGKPVKILDLAKRMIQLSSSSQTKKIEIKITGIRPGEKLHEELMHQGEELIPTPTEGLLLVAPRLSDYEELRLELEQLAEVIDQQNLPAAMKLLAKLVPEYQP